jgi:phytoene synthase
MSFEASAALVERADPERFRATMVAPIAARRILFPLYAFNVEVSRAPWVTEEPMIAEMRLQWWRDALEEIATGRPVRKHEVVDALAGVLDAEGARVLDGLIASRRWDIYKDAFEDAAHFDDYIDATSGHLMWTAARLLGAADEKTIRDFAYSAGISNWFRAIPALEGYNRKPLVDGSTVGVKALADAAMTRLGAAKTNRRLVSKAAASALIAGYNARPTLSVVAKAPNAVAHGLLEPIPLRGRFRFLHVSLRGWWV